MHFVVFSGRVRIISSLDIDIVPRHVSLPFSMRPAASNPFVPSLKTTPAFHCELSASMRSTLLSLFSDRDEDSALGADAADNNLHGAVSGRQRWQRYVDLI
jgi:hypothetical protein